MNLRVSNLTLLLTVSLSILMPKQVSAENAVYTFCSGVPGKIEHFIKEEPKAAMAVILALVSIVILKDVIVSSAEKTVKIIKKNPVTSLGAAVLIAGAAYGFWDHYYNQETDLIEKMFNSTARGVRSFSEKLSRRCLQVRDWYSSYFKKQFGHMTYESAHKACQVVSDAKERVKNKIRQ